MIVLKCINISNWFDISVIFHIRTSPGFLIFGPGSRTSIGTAPSELAMVRDISADDQESRSIEETQEKNIKTLRLKNQKKNLEEDLLKRNELWKVETEQSLNSDEEFSDRTTPFSTPLPREDYRNPLGNGTLRGASAGKLDSPLEQDAGRPDTETSRSPGRNFGLRFQFGMIGKLMGFKRRDQESGESADFGQKRGLRQSVTDVQAMYKDDTTLVKMVQTGNHRCYKMLLQRKDTINEIKDKYGRCLLAIASKNGHHKVVEVLLQMRADPNIYDGNHDTPLCLAAYYGEDVHCKVAESGRQAERSC